MALDVTGHASLLYPKIGFAISLHKILLLYLLFIEKYLSTYSMTGFVNTECDQENLRFNLFVPGIPTYMYFVVKHYW